MSHEEFSFSADSQLFSSSWKRNPLCQNAVRAKNVFCTHGTALGHLIQSLEFKNPSLCTKLKSYQAQLFSLDHEKGELEKYVFEVDPAIQSAMKEKLKILHLDYDLICQELEDVLSQETLADPDLAQIKITTPSNKSGTHF